MQSDAVDQFGQYTLTAALTSSLIGAMVMFSLICCGGGFMRLYVNPDGGFVALPVIDAPAVKGGSDEAPRASLLGRCTVLVHFLLKFGP